MDTDYESEEYRKGMRDCAERIKTIIEEMTDPVARPDIMLFIGKGEHRGNTSVHTVSTWAGTQKELAFVLANEMYTDPKLASVVFEATEIFSSQFGPLTEMNMNVKRIDKLS